MKLFRHSQQNPHPLVTKDELELVNGEADISEGRYSVELKSNALSQKKPIVTMVSNPHTFQITTNFNPQSKPPRVIVLIGKDDPLDRRVFELPILKTHVPTTFTVSWFDNKIQEASLGGKQLIWFIQSKVVN